MSVSPGSSEQALAARCYATRARKGVKLSAAIRPHLEKSAIYANVRDPAKLDRFANLLAADSAKPGFNVDALDVGYRRARPG